MKRTVRVARMHRVWEGVSEHAPTESGEPVIGRMVNRVMDREKTTTDHGSLCSQLEYMTVSLFLSPSRFRYYMTSWCLSLSLFFSAHAAYD